MQKIKKLVSCIMLFAIFVMSAVLFTACDETKINLVSNMINLGFTSVTYDGAEKKPSVEVVVDNEVISSDEFEVTYSSNVNVGTGIVKVKAKEDSKVISGTISVGFEIVPATKNVSTLEEINGIINNSNYAGVKIVDDFTLRVGESLVVPENFLVDFGNKILTNNGYVQNNGTIKLKNNILGHGDIVNNGNIVSEVSNFIDLKNAFAYANKVVLVDDIGLPTQYDSDTEFFVCQNAKYEDIILDLNGHKLQRVININSKFIVNKVTLTSSGAQAEVNVVGLNDCALYFRESHAFDLRVDNIKFVGDNAAIKTNGLCGHEDFNVVVKNCDFEGVGTSAAYLPAKYNYTFINCKFVGVSGYYTKSGNHILDNCIVVGTKTSYSDPLWNNDGCDETGSALILDSSESYMEPLKMTIKGGEFKSISGYSIEEIATSSENQLVNFYSTLKITKNPIYEYGCEKNALFIPKFTKSSEVGYLNQYVDALFEELNNSTVFAAGNYTAEQVEALLQNSSLYIKIGRLENVQKFGKIVIGETEFLLSQTVSLVFGAENECVVECNPIKIENGDLYVVAPILIKESNGISIIEINGRVFDFNMGKGVRQININEVLFESAHNTVLEVEENEYDIYISSTTPNDDLRVFYLGAESGDVCVVKAVVDEKVVYSFTEVLDDYISIYPVGIEEEFEDINRADYQGKTIEVSIYVANKGFKTINLNITLADLI